jgi:hypothetical protein
MFIPANSPFIIALEMDNLNVKFALYEYIHNHFCVSSTGFFL